MCVVVHIVGISKGGSIMWFVFFVLFLCSSTSFVSMSVAMQTIQMSKGALIMCLSYFCAFLQLIGVFFFLYSST